MTQGMNPHATPPAKLAACERLLPHPPDPASLAIMRLGVLTTIEGMIPIRESPTMERRIAASHRNVMFASEASSQDKADTPAPATIAPAIA